MDILETKALEVAAVQGEEPADLVEEEDRDTDDESIVAKDGGGAFAQGIDYAHFSETLEIPESTEFDRNLVNSFQRVYTDVINEFADVEIFLISLDSLLCEFTAHLYHNWTLAGQTIVLAHQVRAFFQRLTDLNAKYKLVWFTGLQHKYEKDAILNFIYSYLVTFLDCSEWQQHVEKFDSPLDPKWGDFLRRLTPSFLLMSVESPSRALVSEEVSFIPEFVSILVQLVSTGIPVIHYEAFSINFSTVFAYRIKVVPMQVANMEERISKIWAQEPVQQDRSLSAGNCKSTVDFLTLVIKEELKREKSDADFEKFCLSVLLSAHIATKAGYKRCIPEAEPPKVSSILVTNCRRRVISALTNALRRLDIKTVQFPLDDLWDGRLIFWIFANAYAGHPVLPYRLQEDFAKTHKNVGFKEALATDDQDTLLSPSTENKELLIKQCDLFAIENGLLDELFKDNQAVKALDYKKTNDEETYEELFRRVLKWRFYSAEERLLQSETKIQLTVREQKRANRERQNLSRWYQSFSDSLEGRGNLLVDFSRTPRLPAIQEEQRDENAAEKEADKGGKGAKKGAGKKEAGGKKGKQAPKLSKKDQILEENRLKSMKKQVESDRSKIEYATNVRPNAIPALEEVKRKLQLDESKAICGFELARRHFDAFSAKAVRLKTLEEKRVAAVDFVVQLKECFTKHWNYFDDAQKEKIQGYWIDLGFYKHPKKKPSRDFNLEIDLIYYQLFYGGRLIDVQTDSREDDRVTGFSPDKWQRDLLDIVDKNESALISAPTSSGKTFIAYYAVEKVLRQSNDYVVVYVCPSKALVNQVCGSIYARFRNKPLVGNKALFGTMNREYADNALNCQVLVTIPECLEQLLLSPEPKIQEFVSRVRYVILDEVHCINTSNQGHIWEHIFLLIQCPFLALSATISNIDILHKWLQDAENSKSNNSRNVHLILYKERWSELELCIQKIKDCPDEVNFARDNELFLKGISLAEVRSGDISAATSLMSLNEESVLHFFTPFSVYNPEKIRMFSIPDDQALTARQVIELYTIMSQVDEKTKNEFEPSSFFGYKNGEMEMVWLTRKMLRELEKRLKERFLHWLHHDEQKITRLFENLTADVKDDLEKRMKPFNMYRSALFNIVPLVSELKASEMLPAICFNDDREFCEQLAINLFNEFDRREKRYMQTPEFKKKFNLKEEEKILKAEKRKRDVDEEKRKKKGPKNNDDAEGAEREDDATENALLLIKMKMKEALSQFNFAGRSADEELYDKTIERLKRSHGSRVSTRILLKLFERGIGFHHDGLTAVERGTVEILFRNGNLGILFSTSTLALGINMPCKTVVFGIDTPQLTPLLFRQMSGRAGRRGYDPAGNVIFMSLPTSKIRRLLTASLATLRGNVPYTASFILRLITYINGNAEDYETREEIAAAYKSGIINEKVAESLLEKLRMSEQKKSGEKSALLTKEGRITASLALFNHSFVRYTRKAQESGKLPAVLRALVFFNVQLLRRLQLLNEQGETTGFAKIAVHMGEHEPGNLLFTYLLQQGAFHNLRSTIKDNAEFKDAFILILAHLFTNRRLPITDSEGENPIALKPLPEKFATLISKYNTEVEKLFIASLQLFFPNHQIENEYFRLSGASKAMSLSIANIVSSFDDEITLDPAFIPAFCEDKDHRGRTISRNSYAYDFYKHGSKDLLISENKIDISEVWYVIRDFNQVLQSMVAILTFSARMTDPLLVSVTEVAEEYEKKFYRGFGMKIRDRS